MLSVLFNKKKNADTPSSQKSSTPPAPMQDDVAYQSVLDEFVESFQHHPDMSINQLMDFILAKARRATVSEAGSIFIVDPLYGGDKQLLCCSLQNDALQLDPALFKMPINDASIAGFVANRGDVVSIDDLYEIPGDRPYTFNRSFDDKHGYRSTSMLAFPLKNIHNEIVGVVQLINHIKGVDENGDSVYGSYKPNLRDEMTNLIIILGMIVERTALAEELKKMREDLTLKEKELKDLIG